MPQTQDDPVTKFQSLPRDRQSALLKKMSPEQKQKLNTAIQGKLKAKQAKPATAEPEESTLAKVGRGAVIGAFEGAGIKPSTSRKEVLTGTAQQFGQGISGLVKDTWEANRNAAVGGPATRLAATAIDLVPTMLDRAASSIEQGVSNAYKAVQKKDWESAAEHAASTLTQIALLKSSEKGKQAFTKEGTLSLSKQVTKDTIQKFVHDRSMAVRDHLETVQSSVKAEDAARWQHLESVVDTANPKGAIDLSKIGRETESSVKGTIKTPQKLPATVSEVQKGSEAPRVFGSRLDPSNASHAALIEKLKESGAIPDSEQASFGQVRQLRSKLGRELRSRSTTLSGESKAVGWKLYGDLTKAMSDAAEKEGMKGSFTDANKFHGQYMDDWGPDTVLGKAIEGTNAHDVLSDISSPKHAEELKRVMSKYQNHGIDAKSIIKEGQLFQKLGSGMPSQLPFSRWEALTYAVKPAAGPLYSGSREAFNWYKREKALQEVKTGAPEFPPARDPKIDLPGPDRPEPSPTSPERPAGPSAEEGNKKFMDMVKSGGIQYSKPPVEPSPMVKEQWQQSAFGEKPTGEPKIQRAAEMTRAQTAQAALLKQAQALKAASEKLGPKASVKEIMSEAKRSQQ